MRKIYHFKPYLKPVIWGGTEIERLKHLPCEEKNIGESWEISSVAGHESEVDGDSAESGLRISELIDRYKGALVGNKVYARHGNSFPLLIKFIDAHSDLSVQVHPDDELALKRHSCGGKTEMWYIMRSAPGARIVSGLSRELTKEEYRKLSGGAGILDFLAVHESHPGDVFFLPAGRIHSIGAGNLLVEIQQPSDITYRVYDYDRRDSSGRTRELHVEDAADAIDYTVYPDYRLNYDSESERSTLVASPYFRVERLKGNGVTELQPPRDSFLTLTCVEGEASLDVDCEKYLLEAGQTVLIAASVRKIMATGNFIIIAASID